MTANNHAVNKRQRDVGLQPERTVLSWFRTIAVIYLNSLLLIKVGSHHNNTYVLGVGIFVLLIATVMYAYCLTRNKIINDDSDIVSNKSSIAHKLISINLALVALLLFFSFVQEFVQILLN